MDGLVPVVRMMSLSQGSTDDELIIDFSRTRFVSPVFVMSLLIWLFKSGKRVIYEQVPDYLNTIAIMDGGICPDTMRQSEFLAIMEKYAKKTFIPVVSFPTRTNNDDKEAISSVVESIIIRQLNIPPNVAAGLKYMIEETLDNITEHSNSDRGFIFAQSYPQKGFLDICMADKYTG